MELKAVKKYSKAKYPTDEEVKEDKDLLLKPLDKWKRVGITSGLLAILLASDGLVRAMDYIEEPIIDGGMDSIYDNIYEAQIASIEWNLVKDFKEKYNIEGKYSITLTDEEIKTMAQDLEKTLKENKDINGTHLWCVLYDMYFPVVYRKLPDGNRKRMCIGYFLLQYFDDDFITEMLSNASSYYFNEIFVGASTEFKRKCATYLLDNIDKKETIEILANLSQEYFDQIIENASTEQRADIERKIRNYNFNQFIKENIPENNFAFSKDNLRKSYFEKDSDNFYESFVEWLLVQGIM